MAEGRNLRKTGQLAEASRYFEKAAFEANRTTDPGHAAEALVAKAGCEIRLFQYATALKDAQSAKTFAFKGSNPTSAGAASVNISTIYSQLGDFTLAGLAASESVEALSRSPRKDFYAQALVNNAEILFGLNERERARKISAEAISVAKAAKQPLLEAQASDHLGSWLTLEGSLVDAEAALRYALNIYKTLNDDNGLAGSYEHLAELDWRKGGPYLEEALSYINLAFSTKSMAFKTTPQYYPIHTRGQILLSLGRRDQALAEFRRSVTVADNWRQSAFPGDATNIRTVAQLDSVYKDFAHLAAELSLERDDHALAREGFEVLARNRAAGLREQLTRSYSDKLLKSPEYFELLQELGTAQAAASLEQDSQRSQQNQTRLASIRARLSDLENRIGLDGQNLRQLSERKGQHASLKGIQSRLGESEALLSFSLGERKSFLWAVTNDDLRLYDLPSQDIIAQQAGAFSRAVAGNGAERAAAGRALSRSLFANIAPSLKRRPNWLLTPDGALLDKLPFADLPATFGNSSDKPLIFSHSLRVLPTALLLENARGTKPNGRFIGVGDPIYNLADSRLAHKSKPSAGRKPSSTALARLVGSEREVRVAAEKCGLPQAQILTGQSASGSELRELIQNTPEILHFAVHVVSPKDFPQEAALALSLTKDNLPELLTAESAATYRIPGSLVVLSGCASQQGEVLPGAGLIGLSRGWLLAGASAVIVSAWPTPDDSGQFFSTFYGYFRQTMGSIGKRAATALQQTQLEMQRSGGYRSEPKFWAAYSIVSKE